MIENIFVGIMVIAVAIAAVYGWRLENGGRHADKNVEPEQTAEEDEQKSQK